MAPRPNEFLRRLRAGDTLLGWWSALGSPTATEILGGSGADWVLIDTEHAVNELPDVVHHLRALAASPATPLVRPPWNDPVAIKRLLDAGVPGLIVPFVQDAEQARAAVAATRYPPAGIRGVAGGARASDYGRVRDYLARAHEEIAVIVQIETADALGRIEAIAAVEGVDAVFVGPSDLAASMGLLGQPRHPDVDAACAEAAARAARAHRPAGIFCLSEDHARHARAQGFRMLALGADAGLLRAAADGGVARLRG